MCQEVSWDSAGRLRNFAARLRHFSGLLHRRVPPFMIVADFEVMSLRAWGDKFSLIFIGYERVFLSEFSIFIGPGWQSFTIVAVIRSHFLFRECGAISSSLIWRGYILRIPFLRPNRHDCLLSFWSSSCCPLSCIRPAWLNSNEIDSRGEFSALDKLPGHANYTAISAGLLGR